MTLARRLSLMFTALAIAAAAATGGLAYVVMARSLAAQLRTELDEGVRAMQAGVTPDDLVDESGSGPMRAQTLSAAGPAAGVAGRPATLPVGPAEIGVARAAARVTIVREVRVDGVDHLMSTQSRGHGSGAVQVAYSLQERDRVLDLMTWTTLLAGAVVAVVAAGCGALLARLLTRRLVRLTEAVEQIGVTGRPDRPVPVHGDDEVGRLGSAFDGMLERLARSREQQQRLAEDAGHELRTPLTSIRTNVALLHRADRLTPQERRAVLEDLAAETGGLSALVDELVELATDRHAAEGISDVDLAELAERVAERASRRTAQPITLEATVEIAVEIPLGTPTVVRGRPGALERALTNLVGNPVKLLPAGGAGAQGRAGAAPIEIRLSGNLREGLRVAVADRGPGVPEQDLELIFDRFHRAVQTHSLPGSGLGLAIVKDVALDHDGQVFAANRPGGGAVIGFSLPPERLRPAARPAPCRDRAGPPNGDPDASPAARPARRRSTGC